MALPDNNRCADCGNSRNVHYTSVSFGIFICNRCAPACFVLGWGKW